MIALSSLFLLVACSGSDAVVDPNPTVKPANPKAEPKANPEPAKALEPLKVELEDNQKTCFGDADCVPVQLDCCCGGTVVASNKGSAEAVKKAHTRPKDQCAGQVCEETCPESKTTCVQFKCALSK